MFNETVMASLHVYIPLSPLKKSFKIVFSKYKNIKTIVLRLMFFNGEEGKFYLCFTGRGT